MLKGSQCLTCIIDQKLPPVPSCDEARARAKQQAGQLRALRKIESADTGETKLDSTIKFDGFYRCLSCFVSISVKETQRFCLIRPSQKLLLCHQCSHYFSRRLKRSRHEVDDIQKCKAKRNSVQYTGLRFLGHFLDHFPILIHYP